MLRAMSSYVYIKRRLHPGLLDTMVRGGAQALELFAARGHFNYHEKEHVRELGSWFKQEKIEFHSMHSPIYMSNDFKSGGQTVNIVDPDKRMRIEAMDEIKRAIEVAEYAPFRFLIQHIGKSDEYDDPRKFENALSGIEHLRAFARPLGVSLLLENTPNDLATPERLKEIIKLLRYEDLGVCFDVGHAHLMSSVHQAFGVLEDRIRSTHIHDNRRDKDSHLCPGDGTIDWEQTMQSLRAAPHAPAMVLEIEGEEGMDVAARMASVYGKLEEAGVAAE
ncbi:MAG TPA: sugar phosphate isomerase/epimerase family protein [Candidatus Angelobacter sp.]|nr:sugar phosphate isomerase/epimerase family protein [Candidatus Angelobacter sp.]